MSVNSSTDNDDWSCTCKPCLEKYGSEAEMKAQYTHTETRDIEPGNNYLTFIDDRSSKALLTITFHYVPDDFDASQDQPSSNLHQLQIFKRWSNSWCNINLIPGIGSVAIEPDANWYQHRDGVPNLPVVSPVRGSIVINWVTPCKFAQHRTSCHWSLYPFGTTILDLYDDVMECLLFNGDRYACSNEINHAKYQELREALAFGEDLQQEEKDHHCNLWGCPHGKLIEKTCGRTIYEKILKACCTTATSDREATRLLTAKLLLYKSPLDEGKKPKRTYAAMKKEIEDREERRKLAEAKVEESIAEREQLMESLSMGLSSTSDNNTSMFWRSACPWLLHQQGVADNVFSPKFHGHAKPGRFNFAANLEKSFRL